MQQLNMMFVFPKTSKKAYLIHKHDTFAMKNNRKFDVLSRMPRKSKRALGVGMYMKTRTPHQNQTKIRRVLSLPEFLFFPGAVCFLKRKEERKN